MVKIAKMCNSKLSKSLMTRVRKATWQPVLPEIIYLCTWLWEKEMFRYVCRMQMISASAPNCIYYHEYLFASNTSMNTSKCHLWCCSLATVRLVKATRPIEHHGAHVNRSMSGTDTNFCRLGFTPLTLWCLLLSWALAFTRQWRMYLWPSYTVYVPYMAHFSPRFPSSKLGVLQSFRYRLLIHEQRHLPCRTL